MPFPREEAFAWHERDGAFGRLTPPFEPVELESHVGGITDGARVVIKIKNGPVTLRWHALHSGYTPPELFVDDQEKGPFASWHHEHRFLDAPGGFEMHDHVEYRLPFHGIASVVAGGFVRAKLDRMFTYRHETLASDLADHARHASVGAKTIVVTGASGTIGEQLCAFLSTGGHTVRRLIRDEERADPARGLYAWDPAGGSIDRSAFEGADAVVHLAGETVFALRWSAGHKRRILESRQRGTSLIARTMAEMEPSGGPRVLVSASAVGFYGDRPGEVAVDESGSKGQGFLADVCEAWERGADAAADAGVRVVWPRIGVVLTPRGGALRTMLPIFKLGLGGPIGSGRQAFPWITIDDTVRALHAAVLDDRYTGAVNVVSPARDSQRDFARALGRVLRRPAFAPAPAGVVRAVMGEIGREVALKGVPAVPGALETNGFRFRDTSAAAALARILGRPAR